MLQGNWREGEGECEARTQIILFFYFINKLHYAEFHHQSVKCNIVSKFISEMVEFGKVSSKSDTRRKNAIGITQVFFVGA